MQDSRDVKFSIEVSKGIIAKFIMAILGFSVNILFARILGPQSFGSLYIIVTISAILLAFSAGIAQGLNKRMAEVHQNKQKLLSASAILHISSVPFFGIIIFTFEPLIQNLSGLENPSLPLILLFSSIGLFNILQRAIDATGRFGTTTWLDLARDIFRVPAQLLLIFLVSDVFGILVGLAVGTFFTIPLQLLLINSSYPVPGKEDFYSILSYTKHSIPSSLVSVLKNEIDIIILSILATPFITGQYKTALLLTLPSLFVCQIITGGLQPRVSANTSENHSIKKDVRNSIAFASILSIPLFFGALSLGKTVVITVYSSEYAKGALFLSIIAASRVFQSQNSVILSVINGVDRPDITVKIKIIAFFSILITSLLLFSKIGSISIAIAILVGQIIQYIVGFFYLRDNYYSGPFLPIPILKQLFSGIIMLISVSLLKYQVGLGNVLSISLLVLSGVFIYGITLVISSAEIRELVFSNITRIYKVLRRLVSQIL